MTGYIIEFAVSVQSIVQASIVSDPVRRRSRWVDDGEARIRQLIHVCIVQQWQIRDGRERPQRIENELHG